jgi:N-acetylmuramoyl-L-alanine amidase
LKEVAVDVFSPVIRDRRIAASDETRTRAISRQTGQLGYIYGDGSHARSAGSARRRGDRAPSEITTIVLHQTAGPRFISMLVPFDDDDVHHDHVIDRIAAHFAVTTDGAAMYLHDVEFVMSNAGGRHGIDIEICGSFGNAEVPGGERVSLPAIRACRRLIADLVSAMPSISRIHPHGQVQRLAADSDRDHGDKYDSCCGPDVWVNIGQWAVDNLSLRCDAPLGYPDHGISPKQTNVAYRQEA